MRLDRYLTIAALLLLSACSTLHEAGAYKLYPGPERPDSELATLAFGDHVHAMEVGSRRLFTASI